MSSSLEVLNDDIILDYPWAKKFKQTLLDRSNKWILSWCNIVLQLGENSVDIEEWTDIFLTQIQNCYQDLLNDVKGMKSKLIDSIEALLTQIQHYTIELGLEPHNTNYEELSLYEVQKELKKQVGKYEEMYTVRKNNLTAVQAKISNLCKTLGETPLYVSTSPLPTLSKMEELQMFLDNLETMKFEREEMYVILKGETIRMAKELNITATLDFEREVLSENVSNFVVSQVNMIKLKSYHSELSKQWNIMKQEIVCLRSKLEGLWVMLEESVADREKFHKTYSSFNHTTLKALQNEVKSCEDKKKSNIKFFVEKLRAELLKLWDRCYCSNEQKQKLKFFYSDCFEENLLELHEMELKKWNTYYEENKQMIVLLREYTTLWDQMICLENNVDGCDVNRYKNRGGQLLREEKERARLTKMISKIEDKIKILSQQYESNNARPFLIYNNTISEHIKNLHDKKDLKLKTKLCVRKQKRDLERQTKLCSTPPPSTSKVVSPKFSGAAASTTKRKFTTPLTDIKKMKFDDAAREVAEFQSVRMENVRKNKRQSLERKKRILKCRRNLNNKPDNSKTNMDLTDYGIFQENPNMANSTAIEIRNIPKINIIDATLLKK